MHEEKLHLFRSALSMSLRPSDARSDEFLLFLENDIAILSVHPGHGA